MRKYTCVDCAGSYRGPQTGRRSKRCPMCRNHRKAEQARLAMARWRGENPERSREYQRLYRLANHERVAELKRYNARAAQLRLYNLTPEAYDQLLEDQGGGCALCGIEPTTRRLAVDHDHACCPGRASCGECIRGLLCTTCNTGIGKLGDTAEALQRAANYLAPRHPVLRP